MDTRGVIVVGVDGSESARTALDFALAEAARRSVRLQCVLHAPCPVVVVRPAVESVLAAAGPHA